MSALSREELIELGVSVSTEVLLRWSSKQLAATKGRETRLNSRGWGPAFLTAARDLHVTVEQQARQEDSSRATPQVVVVAQRIFEEASEYRREALQIVQVEFGTSPDVLARFRVGVRSGLLLGNLARELETLLALLREFGVPLAGLGATGPFLQRGTILVERLREAKAGLDAACGALPPPELKQCHDKGLLYDLTRRLVRTARLEFHVDPHESSAFTFNEMRKARGRGASDKRTPQAASGSASTDRERTG